MKPRGCVVFLLAVGLSASLVAQESTGTIEGTALDPSGAPMPRVKITITNMERNQVVRTVVTDPSGIYSAPFLPVGSFSIRAERAGFKTELRSGIALNVIDVLNINLSLQFGAVTAPSRLQTSDVHKILPSLAIVH